MFDRSGNGNTGTMTNMTTSSVPTPGKLGQAFKFDGVNDQVKTGSDFITTNAVTITAWINALSLGGGSAGKIIDNGNTIFRLTATNKLQFASDGISIASSTTNSVPFKKWVFVSVTRDVNGTANFYIDGRQNGDLNQNSGDPADLFQPITNVIIGNNNAGTSTFDGFLDDVRVYNRSLSS